MKELIIVCGVSGSGKTTFAEMMAKETNGVVYAADDFFYDEKGKYNWYASGANMAHEECKANVKKALIEGNSFVYVANTFTEYEHLLPYIKLGKKYKYKTTILAIGKYHKKANLHNVPTGIIEKMKIQLRNSFKF